MSTPPAETTPLSSGLGGGAQAMAANMFTQENAAVAGDFAKAKAAELRSTLSDGDLSIRLLALLGGMAMIVTSVMGFVANLLTLHWVAAVIDVYTFVFGVIVIVLEGKDIPFLGTMRNKVEFKLHKYALFLTFVWGRGLLYFVAGTLMLTQAGWLDLGVGAFMCLVGIMYLVVGRQTSRKLKELRKSLYSEHDLKAKFDEADSEGTGTLSAEQFRELTRNLGMDLKRREIEAAFFALDKQNADGKLSYDEFKAWWAASESDDYFEERTFDSV